MTLPRISSSSDFSSSDGGINESWSSSSNGGSTYASSTSSGDRESDSEDGTAIRSGGAISAASATRPALVLVSTTERPCKRVKNQMSGPGKPEYSNRTRKRTEIAAQQTKWSLSGASSSGDDLNNATSAINNSEMGMDAKALSNAALFSEDFATAVDGIQASSNPLCVEVGLLPPQSMALSQPPVPATTTGPVIRGDIRRSCGECSAHKKKCDGGAPCKNCIRWNKSCYYMPRRKPGPAPKGCNAGKTGRRRSPAAAAAAAQAAAHAAMVAAQESARTIEARAEAAATLSLNKNPFNFDLNDCDTNSTSASVYSSSSRRSDPMGTLHIPAWQLALAYNKDASAADPGPSEVALAQQRQRHPMTVGGGTSGVKPGSAVVYDNKSSLQVVGSTHADESAAMVLMQLTHGSASMYNQE